MRAGDLRRRVTVQKRTVTQDTYGQQTTTWSDLLTNVPADIQNLAGRELLAAQAINAELTHKVVVRYHPLLANPAAAAGLRVRYVNAGVTRTFNVQSASNLDERNRTIEMTVAEGMNDG